jgi:RNase P subunit RPR2
MNKQKASQIALERIYRLADIIRAEENPERVKRYKHLMKELSTRNRARIPKELKKEFFKRDKNEL